MSFWRSEYIAVAVTACLAGEVTVGLLNGNMSYYFELFWGAWLWLKSWLDRMKSDVSTIRISLQVKKKKKKWLWGNCEKSMKDCLIRMDSLQWGMKTTVLGHFLWITLMNIQTLCIMTMVDPSWLYNCETQSHLMIALHWFLSEFSSSSAAMYIKQLHFVASFKEIALRPSMPFINASSEHNLWCPAFRKDLHFSQWSYDFRSGLPSKNCT